MYGGYYEKKMIDRRNKMLIIDTCNNNYNIKYKRLLFKYLKNNCDCLVLHLLTLLLITKEKK